jgi:hypothetical protein
MNELCSAPNEQWTILGHWTAIIFFCIIFGELECVGHSFAYFAHFIYFRDVWILTQRAAVASRRAANFATHLPNLATHPPESHCYPTTASISNKSDISIDFYYFKIEQIAF